jgi:hypothetical protein
MTPAQAASPGKELPSFPYVFAHQYLPQSLYADPQLGLALAFSRDRQDLLLKMWDHCRQGAPELKKNADPAGVAVVGGRIADNTALACIIMPRPQQTPEAYYICVLTSFTVDGDGAPRAGDIAYYTLEKSIRLNLPPGVQAPSGQAETVPTVIGSWDKDRTHANHGQGPAPDAPGDFVSVVLDLHAKKIR